ncbi:MAG: non-hydrolyzing UDP-N-acetylglucosamine 2-epimerase [Acidimicrobiales bacterium]
MKRVLIVFGTRPEAIKLAPVVLGLRDAPGFQPVIAVTAQHRAMLTQVLELFGLEPDLDLNIIQDRQTLTGITTRALEGLSKGIEATGPDAIVVQGDTTTTLTGALAGFYHRVPVLHVEAGLRTGNPHSPFPEEVNRRLTSELATLHLAPTAMSRDNLLGENVAADRVWVTGNTVIDALLWVVSRPAPEQQALARLDGDRRRVLLVTAHRRESWGSGMRSIGRALADIARSEPDLSVVFPIHRNPVVREAILPALEGIDNVVVMEPVDYSTFAHLMRRSHILLTDSGGVQEEGPSLGKPVLVMRDTTERPEAVEAGTARLVGTDRDAIVGNVRTLLHDEAAYRAMAVAVNPYGDGEAARRTVAALAHFFGLGPAPDEFLPLGGALLPRSMPVTDRLVGTMR